MTCLTWKFFWRRACPSCRGRHLLSLRGESKQRLAKGHLWNPFWGTVPVSANDSYCKGAPMKMPTLRTSSKNKPCCPVCRRAFSERSRQLAVFRCSFAAFFADIIKLAEKNNLFYHGCNTIKKREMVTRPMGKVTSAKFTRATRKDKNNNYKSKGCFRVKTASAHATNGARSGNFYLNCPAIYMQV